MRAVTNINKADDVIMSLPLGQFRVILKEIDDLRRELSDNDEAEFKEHIANLKEYARTGKIASFDQEIEEAGLNGHPPDCTAWDSENSLYGGECSCGGWA